MLLLDKIGHKFWIVYSLWNPSIILRNSKVTAGPVRAGFSNYTTALSKETRINIRRRREWLQGFPKFLLASPSFHGGRGALPSAGGHPADLTFLAGGGCWIRYRTWNLWDSLCVLQNFERMVLVKQFDDDYCLFKQNSGSELSKCTGVPLRGGFFFFLFSFLLFHFFPQERVRGAFWFLYYSHVAISINFLWIEPHGLHFFFYTFNLILSSLNTWIFPFFENVEKKKKLQIFWTKLFGISDLIILKTPS